MNEVWIAIYNVLTGAASLTGVDIYDHVPQDHSNYPFIKIMPFEASEDDTDTEQGFVCTLQINVQSRYRGQKEVLDLQQKIYDELHRVTVADTANYGITTVQQSFQNVIMDSDGITRHGIQRFTVMFEPLPA